MSAAAAEHGAGATESTEATESTAATESTGATGATKSPGSSDAGDRRFPPELRVRLRRDFETVYAAETRKRIGPFVVHAVRSPVGHARIGFGIPRRFGNAPRRNLMRRRLREAFRHIRADLPPLDLVVHVRPHDPVASVERCREMLRDAARRLAGRLDSAG